MASPVNQNGPLTPPAEPPSQTQTSQPTQPTVQTRAETLLSQPLTSLSDDGTSKRPRDHRLIHLLLASHGVSAYQERVPLQLMDFAYRYTSSVLSDALHIQGEGFDQAEGTTQTKGRGANKNQHKTEEGDISLASLRMSIGSRISYQFQPSMPKEFLKSLADERNRISLSASTKEVSQPGPMVGGVKLPHERYCLTGMGWGLKDEWDSEGDYSEDGAEQTQPTDTADIMQMDGIGEDDEDQEGLGTMEDVFGPDGGGAKDEDEDEEMQDS